MHKEMLEMIIDDYIETQIKEFDESITKKYYQKLIKLGASENSAKEILCFYYQMFLRKTVNSEEVKENEWEDFLKGIDFVIHTGEYDYDRQDERRNLKNIKKKYGSIKENTMGIEEELNEIESYLRYFNYEFEATSYEARKIINIVIDRIMNIPSKDTSDYSDYASERVLIMADILESACNPFVNEHLKAYLSEFIDVENPDNYDKIFKNILLCLNRIIESIDKWEKELGKNGYFRFINQYVPVKTPNKSQFVFKDKTLEKNL